MTSDLVRSVLYEIESQREGGKPVTGVGGPAVQSVAPAMAPSAQQQAVAPDWRKNLPPVSRMAAEAGALRGAYMGMLGEQGLLTPEKEKPALPVDAQKKFSGYRRLYAMLDEAERTIRDEGLFDVIGPLSGRGGLAAASVGISKMGGKEAQRLQKILTPIKQWIVKAGEEGKISDPDWKRYDEQVATLTDLPENFWWTFNRIKKDVAERYTDLGESYSPRYDTRGLYRPLPNRGDQQSSKGYDAQMSPQMLGTARVLQ